MNNFSNKIKEQRKNKRLSIRKCAELVGISPTYLVRIEDGTTPPPSSEVIQSLTEVLELDINELNELANEYLEYLGKSNPDTVRVPYADEVPAFLRTVGKYVKESGEWEKIGEEIIKKMNQQDKGLDGERFKDNK